MLAKGQDHELLEEAITHHELLRGTGDVSIVVQNAHASESGDLDLEGDVGGEVDLNLGLAGGVGTDVVSSRESGSESLVPNLINHCL